MMMFLLVMFKLSKHRTDCEASYQMGSNYDKF